MTAVKRLFRFKKIKQHCIRTKELAEQFGRVLNLNENDLNALVSASKIHDIGKLGISKVILNKHAKLNNVDYSIVKYHSLIGYSIINDCLNDKDLALIVKHHHERYDGTGYPDGLRGKEIPFLSRVLSIIDSFDAMREQRPYRASLTLNEALLELLNGKGKQFDSELVDVFIKMVM